MIGRASVGKPRAGAVGHGEMSRSRFSIAAWGIALPIDVGELGGGRLWWLLPPTNSSAALLPRSRRAVLPWLGLRYFVGDRSLSLHCKGCPAVMTGLMGHSVQSHPVTQVPWRGGSSGKRVVPVPHAACGCFLPGSGRFSRLLHLGAGHGCCTGCHRPFASSALSPRGARKGQAKDPSRWQTYTLRLSPRHARHYHLTRATFPLGGAYLLYTGETVPT